MMIDALHCRTRALPVCTGICCHGWESL